MHRDPGIAVARPLAGKAGLAAGIAEQRAQDRQAIGEKRPVGLQLVIAAIVVIVAETGKIGVAERCARNSTPKTASSCARTRDRPHPNDPAPLHRICCGIDGRGNRPAAAGKPVAARFPSSAEAPSAAAASWCRCRIGWVSGRRRYRKSPAIAWVRPPPSGDQLRLRRRVEMDIRHHQQLAHGWRGARRRAGAASRAAASNQIATRIPVGRGLLIGGLPVFGSGAARLRRRHTARRKRAVAALAEALAFRRAGGLSETPA